MLQQLGTMLLCHSALDVTWHQLTFCHSTHTITRHQLIFFVTRLPLICSVTIGFCIYSAPTVFLLGLLCLFFPSFTFKRLSMHCVITFLTNSCNPLHNHNSTFPLGLLVTSCWLRPFQIFFINQIFFKSSSSIKNQLSDSTWII